MEWSALAMVVAQVAHAFTPAETDAEGYAGLVGGLVLLLAAMAAVLGVRAKTRWGQTLTGWTGLAIAVGFTVYHALPFRSPLTNPYIGEQVGAPAWISVAVAVGVGAWACYEGLIRTPTSSSA